MKLSLLLPLLPVAMALPPPVIVPRDESLIPGRYIVKLVNQDPENLNTALKLLKKDPIHVYKFGNFGGFAAEMTDDIVGSLRKQPGVEYIEQDAVVKAHLGEIDLDSPPRITQTSTTWGLSRISHQKRGGNTYTYDSSAGSGTCVYVIDSGIADNDPEFEGRAYFVANFHDDGQRVDFNGHGTHVAGTIGSKTYGVAKKTTIYGVKVLGEDGTGTNSGVIAAIDFVANDVKTRRCPMGAVANMSLGGAASPAMNSAVADAVATGVFFAVAAGNDAEDAKNHSPASEPTAFTVGATNQNDVFADFSNYGPGVDILAPGVNVLSTWLNEETKILSGTSMATPHVAGLAAYLLGVMGKHDPADIGTRLQHMSLKSKIYRCPDDTKNYLAYNGNQRG